MNVKLQITRWSLIGVLILLYYLNICIFGRFSADKISVANSTISSSLGV